MFKTASDLTYDLLRMGLKKRAMQKKAGWLNKAWNFGKGLVSGAGQAAGQKLNSGVVADLGANNPNGATMNMAQRDAASQAQAQATQAASKVINKYNEGVDAQNAGAKLREKVVGGAARLADRGLTGIMKGIKGAMKPVAAGAKALTNAYNTQI